MATLATKPALKRPFEYEFVGTTTIKATASATTWKLGEVWSTHMCVHLLCIYVCVWLLCSALACDLTCFCFCWILTTKITITTTTGSTTFPAQSASENFCWFLAFKALRSRSLRHLADKRNSTQYKLLLVVLTAQHKSDRNCFYALRCDKVSPSH